MQNKSQYEKKIDALGKEIALTYESVLALEELIKQSQERFFAYAEFYQFFYEVYRQYQDTIIFRVNKLHDKSRGSLSVVQILELNIKIYNDDKSKREQELLEKIDNFEINKKIKVFRNKLGKAHLDEHITIDQEKTSELYRENKFALKDVVKYLELLTLALDTTCLRLEKPFNFLKPTPITPTVIRKLFMKINNNI